ncbi:DUF4296 domain-containing protein [Muricauda oceani]|uniref:DUF4296 domain-containing protein n=1 Tax=Flagellimonas oceani TaxID=2698672 RepID=A0A6G7J596_9FLAO|nr:DUF4296 domain-containing protein [Allomuricauda oceani]MBW8242234.1 DUF4296 domain-containing protein [Allomuricauda oceani]QII45995.1 DUF4296 domain-containing protein [Allomuricauda oceani]
MKYIFTYILGFVILVSCAEKVVDEPENLIPKEKMTEILHDLAILNAAKSGASRKFKDSGIDVMEFLYAKYDIDSAQFSQSDLYYASIPLEYQSIYKDVEARLSRQKDTLEAIGKRLNDSIREANIRRTDSLKAIREQKEEKNPVSTSPE